jgi:hypothetical protein
MFTSKPITETPELPQSGLYDIFFNKYGFINKTVVKRVCESCNAVWYDDGTYSGHCDPEDY